jgi:hypothetical protein
MSQAQTYIKQKQFSRVKGRILWVARFILPISVVLLFLVNAFLLLPLSGELQKVIFPNFPLLLLLLPLSFSFVKEIRKFK